MPAIVNRRRNFRLFEYLCSVMSDAELRTFRECAEDEWNFRQSRPSRGREAETEEVEEDEHGPESDERPSEREQPAAKTSPRHPHREPSHISGPGGERLVRRSSSGVTPRRSGG